MTTDIAIILPSAEKRNKAEELAAHLCIPIAVDKENTNTSLFLTYTEKGLTLESKDGLSMSGDFTRLLPRLKPSNLRREFLVKASRFHGQAGGLKVVDATAGMGEDSLLLAAAGFNVILYEKDAVIAALLADALDRASRNDILAEIVERMELHEEDSIAAMNSMTDSPDVIVLDPMFPERQKTALIKKKFQLLQQLEQPCSDDRALLDAALAANPEKIVIKRPLKGPYLNGKKPSYSISGKAIRYDCIVLPKNGKEKA